MGRWRLVFEGVSCGLDDAALSMNDGLHDRRCKKAVHMHTREDGWNWILRLQLHRKFFHQILLLLLLLLRRRSFWAGPFLVVDLMDAMRFPENVGELELGAICWLQGGTKSMSCRGKGRGEWGLGRGGVGGPLVTTTANRCKTSLLMLM
jgi:hypothetical protein